MVELIGWKRFELNKLMKFVGCDESNWWSIMRRSLVIQFRGRFVNSAKIQHMGGPAKAASYGVFLIDNDLKSFLQSEAAAACLFKMVRGCMSEVSSSDMLQFLDDYVNELDGHFTFRQIREACNLDPDKIPPGASAESKRVEHGTAASQSCIQASQAVDTTANGIDSAIAQPSEAIAPNSQEQDQIARAVRGELDDEAERSTGSHARKLKQQSEVVLAALLNSRGDYLNVVQVGKLLKHPQMTT